MAKDAVPIGFFSSFIPSSPLKLVFLGTAPAKTNQIESEESIMALFYYFYIAPRGFVCPYALKLFN